MGVRTVQYCVQKQGHREASRSSAFVHINGTLSQFRQRSLASALQVRGQGVHRTGRLNRLSPRTPISRCCPYVSHISRLYHLTDKVKVYEVSTVGRYCVRHSANTRLGADRMGYECANIVSSPKPPSSAQANCPSLKPTLKVVSHTNTPELP